CVAPGTASLPPDANTSHTLVVSAAFPNDPSPPSSAAFPDDPSPLIWTANPCHPCATQRRGQAVPSFAHNPIECLVGLSNSTLLWTYPENNIAVERWGVIPRWNLGDEIRRLFSSSNSSRLYVVATGPVSALHKGCCPFLRSPTAHLQAKFLGLKLASNNSSN